MTAFCWRFVLVCVRKPRSILRTSICFVEFIGVAWQVTMRFNDMPLLHAAAEGLWSTSQTRTLQKMGRSDSVLSSWFCHLDNSSGGRKWLDVYTYRSDGIQSTVSYGIAKNIGMIWYVFRSLWQFAGSNIVRSRRSKQFHVCLGALMLRAGRNHLWCMAHSHPRGHFRDSVGLVGKHSKKSKLRSNYYTNIIRIFILYVTVYHLCM